MWRHAGKRRFETRFQFFRYDDPQPGLASGLQDVKVLVTLDPDGQGYLGVVNAQQQDLDGNPVGPALCGQVVGRRVEV